MSGNIKKLSRWAILCLQKPEFLEFIRVAYVFGSGDEAIVVAEKNEKVIEVYSIGKQKYIHIMYNVKCTLKISKPTPTCAHVNFVKIHTNCHKTVMKDICKEWSYHGRY